MPDDSLSERPPSPTRRAMLRALLWGAGGLSLLPASLLGCKSKQVPPTCYAPPPPKDAGLAKQPVLVRWAELGAIWREMSAHARGKYEGQDGGAKLKALEAEMDNALAALRAWPELRTLFEERAAHIYREHYFLATCYEVSAWNPMQARGDVEKQMTALQKLVEEGKLTREAAEKAAQAVAVDAEYLTHLRAMDEETDPEERSRFRAIHEQYTEGKLRPGDEAVRAGRHVVEFEAEQPGLFTEEADG
jgi:hypothetical protein